MTNLPDERGDSPRPQDRMLSNRDFEIVIRRAAELQARESENGFDSAGVSESELIRIGSELGLSPHNLQRALAEAAGTEPEEGMMKDLFGPGTVRAGRSVRGDPVEVAKLLERYLIEREFLAVQRRFSDRVVFTRASGMVATMGRATSQIFSRSPLLKVTNLEMAVRPFDDGHSFIALATSLRSGRTAAAASSIVGGGAGAAVTGAILGIAIAPPAALVALPVLGLSVFLGRTLYDKYADEIRVQLESLLDRVEHGELPPPTGGWSMQGVGRLPRLPRLG